MPAPGFLRRDRVRRSLTARCLLESGILMGSTEEILGHDIGKASLRTFDLCVEAAVHLMTRKLTVSPSFVVMAAQSMTDPGEEFMVCIDEVSVFVVKDRYARKFWEAFVRDERFPHRCHVCGSAGFVGFNQVECKGSCDVE